MIKHQKLACPLPSAAAAGSLAGGRRWRRDGLGGLGMLKHGKKQGMEFQFQFEFGLYGPGTGLVDTLDRGHPSYYGHAQASVI
jgi:hypothetical protein